MTRTTRPYADILLKRLENPVVAAHYLNATLDNSPDNFLNALKNVAKAHQMAKVAKDSGIQRETLYRSLSEQGNPTWDTLTSLFGALRLKFIVGPDVAERGPLQSAPITRATSESTIIDPSREASNPLDSSGQQDLSGYRDAIWIPPARETPSQEALA